jgi:hypothetical protein
LQNKQANVVGSGSFYSKYQYHCSRPRHMRSPFLVAVAVGWTSCVSPVDSSQYLVTAQSLSFWYQPCFNIKSYSGRELFSCGKWRSIRCSYWRTVVIFGQSSQLWEMVKCWKQDVLESTYVEVIDMQTA